MGLTARTNSFGSYTFYKDYPLVDGSSERIWDHTCDRAWHTSNPVSHSLGVPWRAPSPYSRSVQTVFSRTPSSEKQLVGTSYVYRSRYNSTDFSGFVVKDWWANDRPIWDDNALNQAQVEALNKLGDGKAELGTTLLEARRSAINLADRAIELARLLLYAKRREWSRIPKHFGLTREIGNSLRNGSKTAASRYLEWHFGWLPLASDIKSAFDILKEDLKPALLLSARKGVTTRLRVDPSKLNYGGGVFESLSGDIVRTHKVTLHAKLDDVYLHQAQQAALLNPLSLAWEIIPYSFVVDWFVPVGNVFQALSDTAGLTFVAGSKSVSGLYLWEGQLKVNPPWIGTGASMKAGSWGNRRETLSSFPHPMFYWNNRSPFTSTRIATALALIRQLCK